MHPNNICAARAVCALASVALGILSASPLLAGDGHGHSDRDHSDRGRSDHGHSGHGQSDYGQSEWSTAVAVTEINSSAGDGCPHEAEDGLSIFIASPRDGSLGSNDIWAADRASIDAPWGEPRNLGEPVNSAFADFCPTPALGRSLFFVSERPGDGTGPTPCGGGDIYLSRQSPAGGWGEPQLLPCWPDGPNTPGGERSPSYVETWYGTFLFYSTNDTGTDQDIYVSQLGRDGKFGPGLRLAALSLAGYDDLMPNVRTREDGALEMVFSSNRETWGRNRKAAGGQDVYVSYSWLPTRGWSAPVNLGDAVNTAGSEQRATLSHDGKRLYFGRNGDIFMSRRQGRR